MPLIHSMAAFWLWFSITAVPVALPAPVTVSGVVIHKPTGAPVAGASIELVWKAGPFFVDRTRRLGRAESRANGRFEATLGEGPVTTLRVRTQDEAYRGFFDLGPDWESVEPVIEVRPSIGVTGGVHWKGDYARLASIAESLLADHTPGTPPPSATLREHFEAGRIGSEDLDYLVENRETLSGAYLEGFGAPPGQARVFWGRREMEYGSADDELRFLSPVESAGRNLRAAAETGDEDEYLWALTVAFVAEGGVTEETLRRWRESGLIQTAWQDEMARSMRELPDP